MSDNEKKIKVKFPAVSYEMIEEAAHLSGCSVKAFAANAILEAAMHVVQGMDDYAYGDHCSVHLTAEEAKALLGLVDSLEDDACEACVDCEKCVDGQCKCECDCETCDKCQCECNKDCEACEKDDGKKAECGCCCAEKKAEEPVEDAVVCEAEPEVKAEVLVEPEVAPHAHAGKTGRKGKKHARK